MTIPSEDSIAGPYNGNGVTTVFPYSFRVLDRSHLRVVQTVAGDEQTLEIDADYTVAGVGEGEGGSVTLVAAPITGQTLTIVREVPFTQETDLENQGAYYAETIERALDMATMRDQQLAEKLTRAIITPFGVSPLIFPAAQDGALIGWDGDGHLENKSGAIFSDAVLAAQVAQAARDDIAAIVAAIGVIKEHPPFTVVLGQTSVTIPGGYDVVAYVLLEGLRISGWSAPDGLIVTFPAITAADTDGAASAEMIIGSGFNSVFAFDTVDGGSF
jgi:hypothetical protein